MGSFGLAFAAAIAAASAPGFGPGWSAAPPTPTATPAPKGAPAPTDARSAAAVPLTPNDGCCSDPLSVLTSPNGEHPLSITIESGIQVGRLGLTGHHDGDAAIDPQTGAKEVGANMVDLGGLSYQGKATITGQPLRPVRIELPHSITLYTQAGAEAELSDFRTDLPPVAMLDANGQLQFNFGARITSKGGQVGDFRGRIPIRVEYY